MISRVVLKAQIHTKTEEVNHFKVLWDNASMVSQSLNIFTSRSGNGSTSQSGKLLLLFMSMG
jgi:hypothetical protein